MKNFLLFTLPVLIILFGFSGADNLQEPVNKLVPDDSLDFMVCTPATIAPVDGSQNLQNSIKIEWTSCQDAESYNLILGSTSDLLSPQVINTADTSYLFDASNLTGITYYWKVQTVTKDKKYSFWSLTSKFTVGQAQLEIIMPHGCNGNCGSCKNPCGRRRVPQY